MKAVVPAAGQGTRLFPQTHTKPKPLVRVAGKPILGHILDNLAESPISEIVVVIGVMKQKVIEFVEEEYPSLNVSFVEQERTEGLGHSVFQAREVVAGDPLCIVLGDMLFDRSYSTFIEAHRELGTVDGSLGIKHVDEPSEYGIVTLESDRVRALEEKPADPKSDLAISGIYVIEDSEWLFSSIEHFIENDLRGAGNEYQLTDALQRMVEEGASFGTFEVDEWYDCGRPDTLLAANRVLLEQNQSDDDADEVHRNSSVVVPPADIGAGVVLEKSVVGPYVSIDDDAEIVQSHVENSIIGQGSVVRQVNLKNSLIGDNANLSGSPNELNIGDSSDIEI